MSTESKDGNSNICVMPGTIYEIIDTGFFSTICAERLVHMECEGVEMLYSCLCLRLAVFVIWTTAWEEQVWVQVEAMSVSPSRQVIFRRPMLGLLALCLYTISDTIVSTSKHEWTTSSIEYQRT